MTKEQKAIINKDIKKYKQLVEYTEGEAQEIFLKITNFLEKIIKKQEGYKSEIHKRRCRKDVN